MTVYRHDLCCGQGPCYSLMVLTGRYWRLLVVIKRSVEARLRVPVSPALERMKTR